MYNRFLNGHVVHHIMTIVIVLMIRALTTNSAIEIRHVSVRQGVGSPDNCIKKYDAYTGGIKTCCDSKYENKNSN